ncbi:MAG: DnaD domain protein [Roseburia sp.]|nr:DnaD domain protein [Roseburia sp.]
MANIKLNSSGLASFTSVPNIFIDKYMINANGEYIKIYLYLLRSMEREETSFSIQHMADTFEYTEKDIFRALYYWDKQGLIRLEFDDQKTLAGIWLSNPNELGEREPSEAAPCEAPQQDALPGAESPDPNSIRDSYTAEQVEQFQDNEAVQEILFITENYLGRTLNTSDIRIILYWYDGLKFNSDLIEYLIETCISNGHTSLRYMEKIALSWAEQGITTVAQARAEHTVYSQSVYGVMNAFGISGRNLIAPEVAFVEKWTKEYGFTMDIVKEACRRTIAATGKASFEYADTILTNWHKNHVHTPGDVVKLDTAHKARTAAKPKETLNAAPAAGSRFHNFPQRTYNYDKLEQKLLKTTS